MMRSMRENTKIIMLVTALAFVGLMVFEWGMDLSGQTSAEMRGGEIGRVNRDAVTFDEYNTIYRNLYDQQARMQDGPITPSQNRQIEQAAWDQVVLDHLIRQEITRRGLEATDREIREAALFMPPPEFYSNEMFYTDGQFDVAKYRDFLASPAMDPQLLVELEAYYRELIPRNKLYQQVVSGAYISDGELWRTWRDRNETARVRYVMVDPMLLIGDAEVSVSDREVESFYRANRRDFQRAATAQVRVVAFDKMASAADSAAALERARELRAEIVGGADFAEVAQRESADPGSAMRGGDLGTFTRGQMVPEFEEAAWSLPVGRVSEPVLSPFGYHLIQVQSRRGDEVSARHILIPVEMSIDTEDELLERADDLERLALRGTLEEAAEELGMFVETVELTPELLAHTRIGEIEEGTEWAFEEETEAGDLSPLFETRDGFYIFELIERSPARTLTLEEAAPGIRARMIAQRKVERGRQIARELVDDARRTSLSEAASAAGHEARETEAFSRVDFVPGIGGANAVIGTAFGLETGQMSDVIEVDDRFFVIEVLERTDADRAEFEEQKDLIRGTLAVTLEQERWYQFLSALREEANVVDRRDALLQSPA